MGIEPTCKTFAASHNGFEDRGRHQAGSHFLEPVSVTQLEAAIDSIQKYHQR